MSSQGMLKAGDLGPGQSGTWRQMGAIPVLSALSTMCGAGRCLPWAGQKPGANGAGRSNSMQKCGWGRGDPYPGDWDRGRKRRSWVGVGGAQGWLRVMAPVFLLPPELTPAPSPLLLGLGCPLTATLKLRGGVGAQDPTILASDSSWLSWPAHRPDIASTRFPKKHPFFTGLGAVSHRLSGRTRTLVIGSAPGLRGV